MREKPQWENKTIKYLQIRKKLRGSTYSKNKILNDLNMLMYSGLKRWHDIMSTYPWSSFNEAWQQKILMFPFQFAVSFPQNQNLIGKQHQYTRKHWNLKPCCAFSRRCSSLFLTRENTWYCLTPALSPFLSTCTCISHRRCCLKLSKGILGNVGAI